MRVRTGLIGWRADPHIPPQGGAPTSATLAAVYRRRTVDFEQNFSWSSSASASVLPSALRG
jgi:hypothetical protein